MIRAKGLFKKFKDTLEDEIVIAGDPTKKKLLFPLDRIEPPLYKANSNVHRLQKELAVQRDYSVQEIRNAHAILSPAEEAVEILVRMGNTSLDYVKIAAKVTDAGDKLDQIVANEINKLERSFNDRQRRVKKWKPDYGFDKIDAVRVELRALTEKFFAFEEIYNQRSLPEKRIKSAKSAFSDYKEKLATMSEIDSEIGSMIREYQEISSFAHLKDFVRECKSRFKRTLLSEGLHKKCNKSDYKEGIEYIRHLEADMNYILANFSKKDKIGNVRERIIQNTSKVANDYEVVKGMQEGSLLLDDLRRLRSITENVNKDRYHRYEELIYLKKLISEYGKAASSLEAKASELIQHEIANLHAQYSLIEAKSKEVPGKISEIEDYVSLVSVMKNDLNETSLKFRVLGDRENSKKANALSEENRKRINELKKIKEAYENIQKSREEVASLNNEIKEYGITLGKIDSVKVFYYFDPDDNLEINYDRLKEEYDSAASDLKKDVNCVINSCINSIDERYKKARQDNSSDMGYILTLYEKINSVRDISDRIERIKGIIEQGERVKKEENERQKREREYVLRERELENRAAEIEVKKREVEAVKEPYKPKKFSLNEFSLTLYMDTLSLPRNTGYFEFKYILEGNGSNWVQRFSKFTKYLAQIEPSLEQEDREYILRIRNGLEKVLETSYVRKDLRKNRDQKQVIKGMFDQIDNYLAGCEKLSGSAVEIMA